MFVDIQPDFELVEHSPLMFSNYEKCNFRILRYTRNFGSSSAMHERQYLNMMTDILKNGTERVDRTGVGTLSMFGGQQTFDVSKYLPLLTTKFVPVKIIIKELLWFLRGETDAKVLQDQSVHIWDGNSSREFLDKRGLVEYREGELGPIYSHQWRRFGAAYKGCDHDYSCSEGFDQIEYVLDQLKNDPFSRRILLSAWNPMDLEKMALPPCHVLFQLYVEEDNITGERFLSGHLYQRSSDYFLAANYNLVSYTILLYIFAKKTGYKPKNMHMSFGDRHIYKNHVEQAKLQLQRNPRPQPIMSLDDSIKDKDWKNITVDDFDLIGYLYHPAIKAEMAV
jgi:thymidylate synthase